MRNIELLIKPASYDCNLNCSYCFYKPVKELYPQEKPRMGLFTLEALISKALLYSGGGSAVFSWQGGEPLLLGLEYFEKIIELQKKHGKPGQKIGNSVQTNGLLLDKKWLNLFDEYKTFLGISIDGDREMQECFRKGSYDGVMNAVKILKETGTEFNVLTVVNSDNVKKPRELYDFYLANDLRYVQLIPCAEVNNDGKLTLYSVKPVEYGEFLCKFFDLWYKNGEPELSVRYFDNLLELAAGMEPGFCGFKDKCNHYLVVEANGDVYPCDFFVQKEWLLGNIKNDSFEELFDKAGKDFSPLKGKVSGKCAACEWNFICKGGCLKYRETNRITAQHETVQLPYSTPDYFCEAYKMFYKYSFDRIKKLAGRINADNLLRP